MTALRFPELPKTFRSLATLRFLNVLAVGSSLAAVTGVLLGWVFGRGRSIDPELAEQLPPFEGTLAASAALSTLVFGIMWAIALRSRATVGKSGVRMGWVVSIPLAMANAATACGLVFATERHYFGGEAEALIRVINSFLQGALAGATVGVVCWLPALALTLLSFGVPIAWSQRLAKKGLAGEERGELVVGAVSTVIACAAAALLIPTGSPSWSSPSASSMAIGQISVMLLALIGAATGSAAAISSLRRERVRRAFVRRVEAGDVAGYRIDTSSEGKVLVRIASMGEGYRVANFEEPLFGLDATGEAQRSMELRR